MNNPDLADDGGNDLQQWATNTSFIRRKEFLNLSKSQRNKILDEQAKAVMDHYESNSAWDNVQVEEWE